MTEGNGYVSVSELADDPVVQDLRKRVQKLSTEQVQLKKRLAEITPQLSRYEKALKVMTGEPLTGVRGAPKGKRGPLGGKAISDEALERIKEDIIRFAEDHEEFRQVDIRTMPDAHITDSGKLSTAFKVLREDDYNFLRLARKSGNNIYFRLTRAAIQEHFEGDS